MRNALLAVWLLAGVALLVVAAAGWIQSSRFKAGALAVPGTVIGTVGPPSSSSHTSTPVVRFTAPTGEPREHRYSAPLAGGTHAIGDDVTILYEPRSGETRMDDWSELYLWPSLLAFLGFIVLLPLIVVGVLRLLGGWTSRRAAADGK